MFCLELFRPKASYNSFQPNLVMIQTRVLPLFIVSAIIVRAGCGSSDRIPDINKDKGQGLGCRLMAIGYCYGSGVGHIWTYCWHQSVNVSSQAGIVLLSNNFSKTNSLIVFSLKAFKVQNWPSLFSSAYIILVLVYLS